ncbi:hypothetical protein ACHAWF_018601 [Thalassiosira exigua]
MLYSRVAVILELPLRFALDTILAPDTGGVDGGERNAARPIHCTRKRTGSLPRSHLIINTKVGRYEADLLRQFDFSYDTTVASVRRSLERMNCDYIDVIQLHDPEFARSLDVLKTETIPALLECRRRGWARAIGLTGYPLEVQHEILVECQGLSHDGAVFDQSLVYCHNNLHDMSLFDPAFDSRGEDDDGVGGGGSKERAAVSFAQFCEQSNVRLMAAAPLSMGLLTIDGPPSWHPAPSSLKDACASAAKACDAEGLNISTLALVYALAQQEVGSTLLGMKDIEEVDFAADLACRFCNETILSQVSSHRENEMIKLLTDRKQGPFASVVSRGENKWDGKAEARKFWVAVDELKKVTN